MIQKPFRGVQLNRTHPLSKGLVGCWLFNEATGETVFDLSGNGNNGTLENGVAWGNGGLEFDGVDDYVSLPSEIVSNINTYTIIAWFKSTDTGTGNIIYTETKSDSGTARIIITCEGNSGFEFSHRDDSSNEAAVFTATQYNDGNWHCMVVIRKASNDWELFIDNILIGTDSTSVGTTTVDRHEIGARRSTSSVYFGGSIDLIYIYNRVLSVEENMWSCREPYAMFEPTFNPALLYSAAPPVGAIMNQFQGANIGADLYNGVFA